MEADEVTAGWTPAMPLDELWEGDMTGVTVGSRDVLLINVDGELRAYEDRCPHQEWPLRDGELDGRELTCTNHLWVFDAVTGQGINPLNCRLTSFPVQVDQQGMICVLLPE